MLIMTHASLATVDELFRYKSRGFDLKDDFLEDKTEQWGIKAHNRPWIEDKGKFALGQTIIEVGGAYSALPKYLCKKFGVEAWIGDDYGMSSGESLWSRWGDPKELPKKYPEVKYVFERFGNFSKNFPDRYFDRIFSVSTLEHIPEKDRLDVFNDMNRCLKPGGMMLHTIDISFKSVRAHLAEAVCDGIRPLAMLNKKRRSEIQHWIRLFQSAGIKIQTKIPNSIKMLDRATTLVETPDIVYRYYPPNNTPKPYFPNASLLVIIEDK